MFKKPDQFHRRSSSARVANPLLNDEFFNELEFEESPPYSLVLHGMPLDWMEEVEDQEISSCLVLVSRPCPLLR